MVFEHLPDAVRSSCSYSRSQRGRRTRMGRRRGSLRIQMMRTSRPFRVSKCLCVDNGQGPGVSRPGNLVILGGCAIEEMQSITFGLLFSPISKHCVPCTARGVKRNKPQVVGLLCCLQASLHCFGIIQETPAGMGGGRRLSTKLIDKISLPPAAKFP